MRTFAEASTLTQRGFLLYVTKINSITSKHSWTSNQLVEIGTELGNSIVYDFENVSKLN